MSEWICPDCRNTNDECEHALSAARTALDEVRPTNYGATSASTKTPAREAVDWLRSVTQHLTDEERREGLALFDAALDRDQRLTRDELGNAMMARLTGRAVSYRHLHWGPGVVVAHLKGACAAVGCNCTGREECRDLCGLDMAFDEFEQRIRAEAWGEGYQRGLRDAEQDVQHGAANPYADRLTAEEFERAVDEMECSCDIADRLAPGCEVHP